MNEEQPKQRPEDSALGPKGPRTPYSVDEPIDPRGLGSEADYFPGKPGGYLPKFRISAHRPRLIVGRLQSN
jgi:hypothetical protein